MSLRFIYISRQFNRSGYYILKELLESGFNPEMVLLPPVNSHPELDNAQKAAELKDAYMEYCVARQMKPLRFMESIKLLAEKYDIPVLIRNSLKRAEDHAWMKTLKPDLVVLGGGWPELIPTRIIEIPSLGVLNTHPSLLPDFRGTDIHRWQVLHGVGKSGATIHYIDETFDTGGILSQRAVDISVTDTPQELFEKTARLSGELMVETLTAIKKASPQKLRASVQAERTDTSRYYSRWKWEDADFLKLDFNLAAREAHAKILANAQEDYKFNGAWASLNGSKFIFRRSDANFNPCHKQPGTIVEISERGMEVCCGDKKSIRISQIQVASEKGYPEEPQIGAVLNGDEMRKADYFAINHKFDS